MARDYKRRRTRKKRGGSKTGVSALSFLGAGFALGAIAAVLVYRLLGPTPAADTGGPVPQATREPQSAVQPPPAEVIEKRPATPVDERFDFYEMLPNFEVVIPESDEKVAVSATLAKVEKPGAYVLQAGSFRRYADADRMKATLALQGVESQIQKVTIGNDQVWHRVRIGPMTNLTRVNRLRTQLRESNIDALLLRVAE